ncbi:MAG TPA: SRPBCC domain-containing protein [Candidatus Limnocylindria bacterium]
MTVTAVDKSTEDLTMTVTAEFDASPERVWQLWADPRQLERWWGPPSYPATFTAHDFRVGGRSEYHMTGPEGPTPVGYWEILELDPPRSMRIEDGFAPDGAANDLPGPGGMNVTIEPIEGGRTRMTIENTFPDVPTMEQLLAMGQEEGMRQAVGQIDAILAEEHVA